MRRDRGSPRATVKPGVRFSEVDRAVRTLPSQFAPSQAYAAVQRGLDILYPAPILNFNVDALAAALRDLDLVAERYHGYRTELSKSDAVFLSIPCAGRTWVRFFLQTYLEAVTGRQFSLVPRSIPRTDISPPICFTHDFLDMFETIPCEPWVVFKSMLQERPLILMTRDLRDLVVSWFHYLRSSQPEVFARLVPSGSIAEFVGSPVVGIERLARLFELE